MAMNINEYAKTIEKFGDFDPDLGIIVNEISNTFRNFSDNVTEKVKMKIN